MNYMCLYCKYVKTVNDDIGIWKCTNPQSHRYDEDIFVGDCCADYKENTINPFYEDVVIDDGKE